MSHVTQTRQTQTMKRMKGFKIWSDSETSRREAEEFVDRWTDSSSHIVAHTSGSTGVPKEINLLKSDMMLSAEATNRFFDINEATVMACPLSVSYIAGKMMVVRAQIAGAKLWVERPSNKPFQDFDGTIDFAAVVPSQVEYLLASGQEIGALLIGGAPLSESTEQKLVRAGVNAFVSYGMTETCSHVALRKVGGDGLFTALPGFTFSADERGCLVIESDKMSFRRIATNDVVELVDDQSFKWCGRFDNVINSGGVKVFPEIIERKLETLLPGRNFYIVKTPDAKWGESPVLVLERLEDSEDEAFIQSLSAEIHRLLQPAERPVAVRMVDEIQRTSNGKLRRQ